MHYYQFNIGDYAKSTKHLTLIEDIAYRRLLDIYYDTEKPLTLNVKQLARISGMTDYAAEINNVLNDFFIETENGYAQKKADEEISNYHAKAVVARVNGQKGGRPKKTQSEPRKTQSVNLANPAETGSEANYKPLTINQEPLTNNQLKEKDSTAINRFGEFWDLYNKKIDRVKCEKKFSKLKQSEVDEIFLVIHEYIQSTPDPKYRKNPLTWLNGNCWKDETQKNKRFKLCWHVNTKRGN